MRIGCGYDVHALVEDRKLILGGVEIDWPKGLDGHSDADVLIHAVCDALLGAAGLGDIGQYFPPADSEYKDIDSRKLLRRVHQLVTERGYGIANVDATIIAERPKMASHIPAMSSNLSSDLALPVEKINIKATTTEGLGFIGREEGIAAQAVALIQKLDQDSNGTTG